METEIATINNSTGFVPARLSLPSLPRLILSVYDPSSKKRELAKPKRAGFQASRSELPNQSSFDEHDLYPLDVYLPNSNMGQEWEESLLPNEIYVKFAPMNQVIKEDLLYVCTENNKIISIIV